MMRLFFIGFLAILIERLIELNIYGVFLEKKQRAVSTMKKNFLQNKKDRCLILMIVSVFVLIGVSIATSRRNPNESYLVMCGYFLFVAASFVRLVAMKALDTRWSTNIYTQVYDIKCVDIVQSGIYSKMRHPVFFGAIIEAVAIPLMFDSSVAFIYVFIFHIPIILYRSMEDEGECLTFYRESYLKYIAKVPFFVFLPQRLSKYINFYSIRKYWDQPRLGTQIDFAWIVHPFSDDDVFTISPKLKIVYAISIKIYRVVREFISRYNIFKSIHFGPVFSSTGAITAGLGIAPLILTKEIVRAKNTEVSSKIVKSIYIAKKSGAKIVSLAGAFSMFGDEGKDFVGKYGIKITNGKHLIAWSTITQILSTCAKISLDPKKASIAIVGVNLGLGRIILEYVKDIFGTIRLSEKTDGINRNMTNAENIKVFASFKEAISESDVVLFTVTGAGLDFSPDTLRSGSIFCDATMPFYMARKIFKYRKDILSLETSWVTLPAQYNSDYLNSISGRLGLKKSVYGCLGEVILLSLEKRWEDYSLDSDTLAVHKILEIGQLAKKHGFLAPDGWCSGYVYRNEDYERVKAIRVSGGVVPNSSHSMKKTCQSYE